MYALAQLLHVCISQAEILIRKRVKEIAAYGPTSFIQPELSYHLHCKRISINGLEIKLQRKIAH